MKLRSLAVNQFKKFTSPMRLDNINDGLNIVVGPNEMGKSTLLDALRAVLFEKYDSKAKPVKDLQNDRNRAAPVVELAFELNEGIYRIRKRFVKRPYARLECPDGRILEGDVAEDELRKLLSLGKPGPRGAQSETLGMWNVLWVKQGKSFGVPDLPESARGNLHSALESEVGTVLGGRRGRQLPQAIEKQLSELVTSRTNNPRGQYKNLLEKEASLNEEIERLEERQAELSDTLAHLDEAQERLRLLSLEDCDKTDAEEIERARERLGSLEQLESRIKAAEKELELRKFKLEKAENEEKERRELKNDIEEKETDLKEARKRHEEVQKEEKECRQRIEELHSAVRAAEADVTSAEESVLQKELVLEVVRLKGQIEELETHFEKAQKAEERQRTVERDAVAIMVTEDLIERIRAADKELEKATSRLSAVATTITFDMDPKRLGDIEVEGESLANDHSSIQAVSPVTIRIPEYGRITVDPAVKNRSELLSHQNEAKTELKEALRKAGVESPEEAQSRYDEKERLLRDADLARKEAELHSPATDDHGAGAQALGSYIESLSLIFKAKTDKLNLSQLPNLKESETILDSTKKRAADARHVLDNARAKLSGPDEELGRLKIELGTSNERYESVKKDIHRLQGKLREAEEQRSDNQLQTNIKTSRTLLSEQEEILTELGAKREDDSLERLQVRIDRLEKAISDRREKRSNLEVEIGRLKSHIEVSEGTGLDEAIQQKNRELELCQEEIRRSKREVDVLTLLLSALRDAEREAKERYMSPVVNRLRPYLQYLFPGADITIDENLEITGVLRERGYEEPFHHLSMGTQEQIAVLVRLAFAEMLVEQGQPATVVLDDALVFSDDHRMKNMFDILNISAKNIQVLIFTCREQLFEGIGGHRLSMETENSEELMSA
ncbi:MAG: AAA family ATPase [Candidatus Dadabacteria bacterium]|nr:AAA family ATPase [Candidatus Dadabacteria bacterium]